MHKKELTLLLREFEKKLNSNAKKNQYIPKLLDYFIEYVYEKYSSDSIEDTFSSNFNKNDLLLSTIKYIEENRNVKKVSAIDDFLIAVGEFFNKVIFIKYKHPSLRELAPFVKLRDEVLRHKDIKKTLAEREKNPALNDDEYQFIIKYLRSKKTNSIVQLQSYIIVKLMLTYGLSLNRIKKIQRIHFNKEEDILLIISRNNSIELKIAAELSNKISEYLSIRNSKLNNELLFVTTENNGITNSFCNKFIKDIQADYIKKEKIKANFTPTGIIKYTLMQMILSGVDIYALSVFTDNKDTVLMDCYERLSYSMSNHINNQYEKLNKSTLAEF